MLLKTMFIFAIATVFVAANPFRSIEGYGYKQTEVTVIALEEPCVRQGGICMRTEDCDPANRVGVQAYLCPAQQHLGVECCYNN